MPFSRDTITANHRNFCFPNSTLYCQMPISTRINMIKRSPAKTRYKRYFEVEEKDCKDGSGLQLIFARMSKNQSCHSDEILNILLAHFPLVDISFLLPLLEFFPSYCKTIKCIYNTSYSPYYKILRFKHDSVPLNVYSVLRSS